MLFCSYYRPIRDSFNRQHMDVPASLEDIQHLEKFLAEEKHYNSFLSFLQGEFSVENLLLFTAASDAMTKAEQALERRANGDAKSHEAVQPLNEEARELYMRFVADTAAMQVNLPSHITNVLNSTFEAQGGCEPKSLTLQELSTVFAPMVAEVLRLMEMDSWKRYMKTEAYRGIVEEVKRGELAAKMVAAASPTMAHSSALDSGSGGRAGQRSTEKINSPPSRRSHLLTPPNRSRVSKLGLEQFDSVGERGFTRSAVASDGDEPELDIRVDGVDVNVELMELHGGGRRVADSSRAGSDIAEEEAL